ncbi:MAG TPA: VOC family protein [Terracidiphilus sp.]|nr:VOC family protein [Terracidiphilus sp.]
MPFRFLAVASLAAIAFTAAAQMPDNPLTRPKITGISHIAVYTSNPAATDHYYREIVGAVKLPDPENPQGVRYALSATQFIEVLPLPGGAGINRLDHTAWNTDDAETLRRYLGSKSWKVPGQIEKGADGSLWFAVKDPEGNKVEFVQPPAQIKPLVAPAAIGRHIIHMGFLVHSRAVEDTFYRDLLGFRPYWFGGMVEGRLDWVSQQAPDSHDWLEYMLTYGNTPVGGGSGIPATISQHDLGVLDHLSIGEFSVDAAYKVLQDGNRLTGTHDAHTQIGKDGKGQFNLYDPDGIRLELMNFHATEKPCCSPFTADDPTE